MKYQRFYNLLSKRFYSEYSGFFQIFIIRFFLVYFCDTKKILDLGESTSDIKKFQIEIPYR